MPDDLWQRLHGTVRYLDSMTAAAAPATVTDEPFETPGPSATRNHPTSPGGTRGRTRRSIPSTTR